LSRRVSIAQGGAQSDGWHLSDQHPEGPEP